MSFIKMMNSIILILYLIVPVVCLLPKAKIKEEWLSWQGCVDFHIAKDLLKLKSEAINNRQIIEHSIDLGLSTREVILNSEGLSLPGTSDDIEEKLLVTWDELEMIAKKKNGCYSLFDDGSKPFHITTLSATTGIPASLLPPLEDTGAPTIVLGGFTMHRIAGDGMNPYIDTEAKLSCIPIFKGAKVLDTCCGLGYTATAAGRRVSTTYTASPTSTKGKIHINKYKDKNINNGNKIDGEVITIEYDVASLEMCAHNPWSQGLFDGSLPITVLNGDSCEIVKSFPDRSFNFVIHDPPARALCRTDLYSVGFYQQLKRILSTNGLLYHYIGNPDSKESGRLYSGIITRLQQAGFVNIKKVPRAFGLTASVGSSILSGDEIKSSIRVLRRKKAEILRNYESEYIGDNEDDEGDSDDNDDVRNETNSDDDDDDDDDDDYIPED